MQLVGSNISSIICHWRYIFLYLICFIQLLLLQPDHPHDLNVFDLQDKTGPDSERPLNSQFPNILLQFSSPLTEYPTTTPTLRSKIQLYQVLYNNRRPNYCEDLFLILLKFSITNNDTRRANSTSTHTERPGLNGDSLPNFWIENPNDTRATAEEQTSNFPQHPKAYLLTR